MEEYLKPYSNLAILIPMVAMFVIIFGIVVRSLKEMPLFAGGGKIVVALCVTILAMYGMDQTMIRFIVINYSVMGIVMLVSLAVLLMIVWITLVVRGANRRERE